MSLHWWKWHAAHCRTLKNIADHYSVWSNSLPLGIASKHKTYVQHLYNVGPTSSTLVRHCINVIQMFCVCWPLPLLLLQPCRHQITLRQKPTGLTRQAKRGIQLMLSALVLMLRDLWRQIARHTCPASPSEVMYDDQNKGQPSGKGPIGSGLTRISPSIWGFLRTREMRIPHRPNFAHRLPSVVL